MATNIFVNLPVKDLNKSMDFWKKLGYSFNKQFTNEQAACLVISDTIFIMLITEEYFKTFMKKEIADSTKVAEVINALSCESKEQVDALVNKALASGGKPSNEKSDDDFMYSWSFQDPDDHLWEVFYMDPKNIK